MRKAWLLVALLVGPGCRDRVASAPSSKVSAPAAAAGDRVQLGQVLRAGPHGIEFEVIAHAGADLAALEQLARERAAAARLEVQIERRPPGESRWRLVSALSPDQLDRDRAALEASPGALVLVVRGAQPLALMRSLGDIATSVARSGATVGPVD